MDEDEDENTGGLSTGDKELKSNVIHKETELNEEDENMEEEGYRFDKETVGHEWQFEEDGYEYGYEDDEY